MPDWRARAVCLDHDPELWFPNIGEPHVAKLAKQICADCPVTTECAADAERLKIQHGIWGGKRMTAHKPPMSDYRQPCGTVAAYRRHHRADETPCEPCMAANRRATADRYWKSAERRRATHG